MPNIIGAGFGGNSEDLLNKYNKFKVEGYDGEKIIIKPIVTGQASEKKEDDFIEVFIKDSNSALSESDTELIKNMIKRDIELSHENISNIKGFINLKNKIADNESESSSLLSAYLSGRDIDADSKKGRELTGFFNDFSAEFKNINDNDDIITLFQNNIEMSGDSLKSFNNLVNGSNVIFNDLEQIGKAIKFMDSDKLSLILKSKLETETDLKNLGDNGFDAEKIKKEVLSKLEDMKSIIKAISTDDSEIKNMILSNFKESLNDFKTFNTLSNQYYMMDVPFKMNDDQYDFKLFIKDDRKSGKIIDKTNVKIVVSVKTINIGSVDAYIKINNKSLMLDIKALNDFVAPLSENKAKIQEVLNNLGYMSYVNVYPKEEEATIVTAADFFNDNSFTGLNIKV